MAVKTVVIIVVVVACYARVSTSSCLLFFCHLVPIHTLNTVSHLSTSHTTFKCCSFLWIIGPLYTLHSMSVQFTISRTGTNILCLPQSHCLVVLSWYHLPSSKLSASFSHSMPLVHRVLLHVIYLQYVLHNWRILHTPFISWQTHACIKQPFRDLFSWHGHLNTTVPAGLTGWWFSPAWVQIQVWKGVFQLD